jgi:hypothetical protein
MAKTGGRQVEVGLGIEATPGTAVAESIFIPWQSFSMQAAAEKELFRSARGVRNESSDSMIKRKYSSGSLAAILTPQNAPYFFGMALGTVATASNADGSGDVYDHTVTVQNANASMKTATLTVKEGGIQTAQYLNTVCDALTLDVSDAYALLTMKMFGQFASSDTMTIAYGSESQMAYHQYTAKFGTSLSAAAGNSATPLKSFSLNINNNVQLDEAFLSGANTIASGGLVAGPLKITGSYSLLFADTTELAKYKANTLNSLIVTFTGAAIGSAASELITIKLSRLVLTKQPIEYKIDGMVVLTQDFEVQFNATDKECTVVVTNLEENAAGATYGA